jgi:DNA polymerase III subunit delta
MHLFDFLAANQPITAGVCVVFGDEPFLKQLGRDHLQRQLLGTANDEMPCASFVGDEVLLRDVLDELSTVSLFGGSGAKRGQTRGVRARCR